MIRTWWIWLWGEPEPDPLIGIVERMITNQNQLFENLLQTVRQTSENQTQTLASYIELFKSPEAPTKWSADNVADNAAELVGMGFPQGGTDQEQAEWVLNNLNQI